MSVLLVTGDLMFSSKVAAAASRTGASVETCLSPAAACDKAIASRPSLVVIDLNAPALDVAALVRQLRAIDPEPKAIIAFGPHVDETRLAAAADAGCDRVMTRGQFNVQMDAILAEFAP